MIATSAHHKFLLLVQTAVVVKDIQTGQQRAANAVGHVLDIDASSFNDFEEDMDAMASMAYEYVKWQYEEGDRPKWITFYNGKYS